MTGHNDLPDNPGTQSPAGDAVAECTGTLVVNVHWGNDQDVRTPYMIDSRIKVGGTVAIVIKGPTERTETTTTGTFTFEDLPCGEYTVGVAVARDSDLVDRALTHDGSTRWAYVESVTSFDGQLSFPRNTNKCNFFIYDMIQQTYGSAPTFSYQRGTGLLGSYSPFWKTVPDLAGSWAENDNTASDKTEGWRNINFRPPRGTPVAPGSILAIAANYSDATGHVGIVSYPDAATEQAEVAGARHEVTVIMQGKTVSAAGRSVVHNDWGFRTSDKPEINSINSPSAGVEVKE